jgi:hypothetical protein
MALDISRVATVELIREIERRVRCAERKEDKYVVLNLFDGQHSL